MLLSLNVTETVVLNCCMEIFSVIIMIIILMSNRYYSANTHDERLFTRTLILIIVTLLADIAGWLLNGRPGTNVFYCLYIVNMIYYIFQILASMEWLRFVYYHLYRNRIPAKIRFTLLDIPFYILMLLVISAPFTKWLFYIDSTNYYSRGILSLPVSIIEIIYLVAASVIALLSANSTVYSDRKREAYILASFIIFPVIGGIVQIFIYGCSFIWPCVTLSVILSYINTTNREISVDALTGLNNRGNLNRYMQTHFALEKDSISALIMIDINDFKSINDKFGHEQGDKALSAVAEILKKISKGMSVFLARYGGDEFVVVMPGGGAYDAEAECRKIQIAVSQFNDAGGLECPLSVSMGYAIYPSLNVKTAEDLIKAADENMYKQKQQYHKREA